MSFLHHEPCPKCGSRDNLGVYEDGHKWCFGCGYYIPSSTTIGDVSNSLKEIGNVAGISGINLPADFSLFLPAEPRRWLAQYELSAEEMKKHSIGWAQSEQMLIFPYFGEDHDLLVWQGRYFPARVPKVFTRGWPDKHLLINRVVDVLYPSSVCVVEDSISAIKVSRVMDCAPLLGANLSIHKVRMLSRYYDNLYLWLDNDKIKEMMKFQARYTHFFKSVKIIISDKDPKYYLTEEIKEFLNA